MDAIIAVCRDLGWGVTAGIVILLVGGPFVYFQHWGETAQERAERKAGDAERAEEARLGPAGRTYKKQNAARQNAASKTSKGSPVPS